MPGFDGTGPLGQGPLTGGGRGMCGSGGAWRTGRGRGLGPCGRGLARGAGWGRGMGWNPAPGAAAPVADASTDATAQRIAALEKEIRGLKDILAAKSGGDD